MGAGPLWNRQPFCRWLVKAYPLSFRRRFGREIVTVLADGFRDARRRGRTAAWIWTLGSLADIAWAGLRERLSILLTRHRSTAGTPPQRQRSRKGMGTMAMFFQDAKFALRTILKRPFFAAVVVVTVALGVGANTAMFSVVKGVLLDRLPFEEPDQLAIIYENDRLNGTLREGASGPDYFDWLERQTVFEDLGTYTSANPTLTGEEGPPERLLVVRASRSLFEALRWHPMRGRIFGDAEDSPGGPLVAVLSHGLWKRRFGSDLDIIGKDIHLDGEAYQVVGVMPDDAAFERTFNPTDVWVPLQYGPTTGNRGNHGLLVVGRMRQGIGHAEAQEQMTRIMAELEKEYPGDNIGRGATVDTLRYAVLGDVESPLLILMAAVILVLLIACANVANLLLSRATARRREVAVREAIGAGKWRIVRQLTTESVLLALAGGTLGVLLAFAGIRLLHALQPASLPRLERIGLDLWVLVFAAAAALATGILFGVFPAMQASKTNLSNALKVGGRQSSMASGNGMRRGLAVVQIVLAFVLTAGAGVVAKSLWRLSQVNPGFRADNLVSLSLNLPSSRYPSNFRSWPNAPEVKQFYVDALERIQGLPFVESAALAVQSPATSGSTTRITIEGGPTTVEEGVEEERIRPISAGYFSTIGSTLTRGRDFTEFDRENAPWVVMVNESFVHKYFPQEDPLGKRIQFWGQWRAIVGVVSDVRFMGLDQQARPAVHAPLNQLPFSGFDILVRGSAPTPQIIDSARTKLLEIDPELAVYDSESVEAVLDRSLAPQRFNAMMLGLFAALALLLATIGVYGVISYGVSQRTHEFGVRMSLGAGQRALLASVLGQGLRLSLIGLALGVGAALLASRFLAGLLFEVSAWDPVTLTAVGAVLVGTALAACLVPARRASQVNPLSALRCD